MNNKKIAIIAADFNKFITDQMVEGATGYLLGKKIDKSAISIHRVPGAFELPLAAQHLARKGEYAAIICIGAVIKGGTPHFDFVSAEAARGINAVSLKEAIPVAFGVLTTNTVEQAQERAAVSKGNKGAEAAESALTMAKFLAN